MQTIRFWTQAAYRAIDRPRCCWSGVWPWALIRGKEARLAGGNRCEDDDGEGAAERRMGSRE
jgi:hypothetical protein